MNVFDFEMLSNLFGGLDTDQQAKLDELYSLCDEYLEHLRKIVQVRRGAITNPQPGTFEELKDFADLTLRPLVERINQLAAELSREIIDLKKLKGSLSMVALALAPSVNLPLLRAITGVEPATVMKGARQAFDLFMQNSRTTNQE